VITREILPEEKEKFNAVVSHPCQSWEWGEFRKKMGLEIFRIGVFKKEKLVSGYQFTLHSLPFSNYTIGYLPRGPLPNQAMIKALTKIGQEKKTIFFRIEPNVKFESVKVSKFKSLNLRPSQRPFFYQYTFLIDLTKSEKELLALIKQKTRYNLRLAQKHGVKVSEDNSTASFETYLKLLQETAKRQGFFAHTKEYHRQMWKSLKPVGIARLLKAEYQGKILAAWILFKFHNVLYYPYGASSSEHRQLMTSNLMMWEAIKLGKKLDCQAFDLWGCLGPKPDPKHPWYGFHRFKQGYGGCMIQLADSFDLILQPCLYKIYNFIDNFRWRLLKIKSKLF